MLNRVLAALLTFMSSHSAFSVPAEEAENQFEGRRVVPILEEPRHRTVHVDGDIFLLDIQINPGDMTLPHTHDAAILYTFISNGEGPLNGRVSGNTDYIDENLTHEVKNEGPGLFRIIALTNYGAGVAASLQDQALGITAAPQEENPWFRSYRIRLEAGEETPIHEFINPNVIIQVTDGKVHVTRPDGIVRELSAVGNWAWRDPQSPYKIINRGLGAVELVINEARR